VRGEGGGRGGEGGRGGGHWNDVGLALSLPKADKKVFLFLCPFDPSGG
jgi:hypothetical protein